MPRGTNSLTRCSVSVAAVLTALVCTKDRVEFLADCLRSLAASMPAGGELLVVAHGDPEAACLPRSIGVDATVLDAPVAGKSRQLNQGVRAAAHDIIVLTDDDCRVPAGWVAAMVAPFADPAVGAVYGPVRGLSSITGEPPELMPPGPASTTTWTYANGAAMAVRRAAVIDVGGYDERLGPGAPAHGEEHDLALRLIEHGWRIEIADAPIVEHLEWRDEHETRANLLVYSRGAGAFLGAALRRQPRRWARLVLRRLRYQLSMWRDHGGAGWTFGAATTWAFARGLVYGLRLAPQRYL